MFKGKKGLFTKKSKFNNKFTKSKGKVYHSAAEAEYSKLLSDMVKQGIIEKIDTQVRYKLPNFNSKRPLEYRADFVVTTPTGNEYIIEVKGFMMQASKVKYAYFEYYYGKKIHLVATTGLKKFDTSFIL